MTVHENRSDREAKERTKDDGLSEQRMTGEMGGEMGEEKGGEMDEEMGKEKSNVSVGDQGVDEPERDKTVPIPDEKAGEKREGGLRTGRDGSFGKSEEDGSSSAEEVSDEGGESPVGAEDDVPANERINEEEAGNRPEPNHFWERLKGYARFSLKIGAVLVLMLLAYVAKGYARFSLKIGAVLVLMLLAYVAGSFSDCGSKNENSHHNAAGSGGEPKEQTMYTCPMHPQVQLPDPDAKCPICGMDLVPMESEGASQSGHPRELKMSERARKLAEIEVTTVARRKTSTGLRVVGKIAYDERRVGYITSWVKGRIKRLYVKYTGAKVRRGQWMVQVYSPELLTTQMELIQAVKMFKGLNREDSPHAKESARSTLSAVRHKLSLLGLTAKQIERIEARGKPMDYVTLHAPVGGVVIEKHAQEQMYVNPGTRLFTIADLHRVWVKLDIYESDLVRIREGQNISFTSDSYPGENFEGRVEFIDPFVDNKTRTVKVRITVDNKDLRLKPDMFVRAVVKSEIDSVGDVSSSKKEAGEGDQHSKSHKSDKKSDNKVAQGSEESPLVIPASAPLITGKRAIVYVEYEPGVYRGREIVLGPRAGDFYVVIEGVKEGEKVVTNGNFKIDSALQLLSRPSMMNPEGDVVSTGHHHGDKHNGEHVAGSSAPRETARLHDVPAAFKTQLMAVVSAYSKVHHGLSRDDLEASQSGARGALDELKRVRMRLLEGEAHNEWMRIHGELKSASSRIAKSTSIEDARKAFDMLSRELVRAVERFGVQGKDPVILFRCSMAFGDKGADWMQTKAGVENPYFGAQMFRCGEQKRILWKPDSGSSGDRGGVDGKEGMRGRNE